MNAQNKYVVSIATRTHYIPTNKLYIMYLHVQKSVLCSQNLDDVEHLLINTSGILPQGSVKDSFMVAVEEISTGFLMRYHVETTVVSVSVMFIATCIHM